MKTIPAAFSQNNVCEELQGFWKDPHHHVRYVDYTTLMTESEEELKSLLMRVKEESERASLKLNIKKTKTVASGPVISCQIEEEKVELATDFLFLGSKITVDSDCSHETR